MIRNIQTIIPGIATSDGAGVKLRRSLGGQNQVRLDPFLMLEEFHDVVVGGGKVAGNAVFAVDARPRAIESMLIF